LKNIFLFVNESFMNILAMIHFVQTHEAVWLFCMFFCSVYVIICYVTSVSHFVSMKDNIFSLAYARYLFDSGNREAAFHFCDRADEKGEILQRELEIMTSSSIQSS
jgi:hypothetical protein